MADFDLERWHEKKAHNKEMLRLAQQSEQHAAKRVELAVWQVRLAVLTLTIVTIHFVYTLLGH